MGELISNVCLTKIGLTDFYVDAFKKIEVLTNAKTSQLWRDGICFHIKQLTLWKNVSMIMQKR